MAGRWIWFGARDPLVAFRYLVEHSRHGTEVWMKGAGLRSISATTRGANVQYGLWPWFWRTWRILRPFNPDVLVGVVGYKRVTVEWKG